MVSERTRIWTWAGLEVVFSFPGEQPGFQVHQPKGRADCGPPSGKSPKSGQVPLAMRPRRVQLPNIGVQRVSSNLPLGSSLGNRLTSISEGHLCLLGMAEGNDQN